MSEKESQASKNYLGIQRIVSGGQTGVDRAALDVAIELKIPHGGWCPKGRRCEEGRIPEVYRLKELESPEYAVRTQRNVIDSDGTLILYRQRLQGGTALTWRFARELGKPVVRVRLDASRDLAAIVSWLRENQIATLNVAGPRASSHPELYRMARELLLQLLQFESSGSGGLFEL